MSGGPVVDVGVVDVLVFRPATKGWLVLVLERAKGTRCPGSWELVHGKVEPGEALEAAALRELREETGLVPDRLLSITMHSFYLMPRRTVKQAAVFAAVVPRDAALTLGEEHVKHAWLTTSQARRRLTWPQDKRSLDDARQLLAAPAVWDAIELQREGEERGKS